MPGTTIADCGFCPWERRFAWPDESALAEAAVREHAKNCPAPNGRPYWDAYLAEHPEPEIEGIPAGGLL